MNYYAAKQRKDSLRWDFTCKNDRNVYPVGYCAGGKIWTQVKKGEHADKYHAEGHDTAEEAVECYRQFLLDNHLRFYDGEGARTLRVCEHPDCDEFTSGKAVIQHKIMFLCDEHRTRENVEALFEGAAQITSL